MWDFTKALLEPVGGGFGDTVLTLILNHVAFLSGQ